jgi:hypothetical protein
VVSILRCRTTETTTYCLVEDPQHPTFCYQILKRWLCTDPPPPAPSHDAAEQAITLSLIALDRFVQLLLTQQSLLADENDEGDAIHSRGSDLVPHPRTTQGSPALLLQTRQG